MPLYQVSYVVVGGSHPGAILMQTQRPQVGQKVTLGGQTFVIEEVIELMPPSQGIAFLHATCRPVPGTSSANASS